MTASTPPAAPPSGSFNPKWILLGCGIAASLGLMLLMAGGALIWFFASRKPAPPDSTAQSWTVRPRTGGFASDSSGASVTVPAGAVDRDVTITLTTQPADAHASPGTRVVGRVASFQVDGHDHFQFKKPVRLSLPIDRALAKPDAPIALSHWDGQRWTPAGASIVSGDVVLANIDHFSEYAPTQDGAGPAPNPNQPRSLADVGAWHGQVEFSLTGNWGHKDAVSSSSHTVSRSASAFFRCSQRLGSINGKYVWHSSFDDPLDRIVVQGRVDDDWYETDSDFDKTGNVYARSNTHGGGLAPGRVTVSVEIDPKAGTYRIGGSDVRVGSSVHRHWVEPNGLTDPPRHGSVTVHLFVGPRPLPSADAAGGFTDTIDVPAETWGFVSPNDLLPDRKHCKGKLTVTLTPVPFKLQAKISGPPVVYRGDPVTLDGSGSTGDIVSYRWSFDVDADCPAETSDVHPTGETAEFSALWGFKATLVVTDKSGNTSKAEQRVQVRPRDGWKVTFATQKGDDLAFPAWPMFAGSTDVPSGVLLKQDPRHDDWVDVARATNTVGGIQVGVNHCACESPIIVTAHWIHTDRKTPGKYHNDGGYELAKLRDAGPFTELVYVKSQRLKIDRRECVNEALKKGGAVQVLNDQRKTPGTAASLLQLGLEHEKMHSTLMQKALEDLQNQDKDPAKRIEKLIGKNSLDVEKEADDIIFKEAEAPIGTASDETKVQAELSKKGFLQHPLRIWLPTGLRDNNGKTVEVDKDLGPLYKIGDK